MTPGTQALGGKWMALGVALHALAFLGREHGIIAYGVGAAAGLALAFGCANYLGGKGYPRLLGLPASVLSVVWIAVCVMVPDREAPPLPAQQLPPRSGD